MRQTAREFFKQLLIIVCVIMLLVIVFAGCSRKTITVVERHDSIITQRHIDTLRHYQRDSVFILMKGDTVFVNHYNTLERERISIKHDTINVNTEKPVVVEKEKKVTPHWAWWLLLVDIVAALMFVAVIILRIKR